LRNPNEGLYGQIPNMSLRAITSLYIELVPPHLEERREKGQRLNPTSCVSCVSSIVFMGMKMGHLQLLVPNLLTEGNGADLLIRGNVVLNMFK
jgi:urease gamma subunit